MGTEGFLSLNLSAGEGAPSRHRESDPSSLTGAPTSKLPPRTLRRLALALRSCLPEHVGVPNHSTRTPPPAQARDLPEGCWTESALKWNGSRTSRRRRTGELWVSPGRERAAGPVAGGVSYTGSYKNTRITKIESVTLLLRPLVKSRGGPRAGRRAGRASGADAQLHAPTRQVTRPWTR